ncbi:MAG: ABC transporter substrate-binding protein [Caulobacterales bacterium]
MTLRRSISRRRLVGQAMAVAGTALLPTPALAVPGPIKFTLAWLATGSQLYVFVARAKGMMKARGIDLEIARGFGSMASAQSIAGGQFDFGIVAAPSLILSVAKNLPLIALATCDYDSTMGVGVLEDSPILRVRFRSVFHASRAAMRRIMASLTKASLTAGRCS